MGRYVFPLLIGILGTGVLVALGVWQVQRLQWKEAVLAEIDARIGAAPVALPADPDREADRYLPVRAAGTFRGEEIHVLVSTKGVGAAFRIIQAFETADGRRVLVDRGIVPDELKGAVRSAGTAEVVGNLHWPEEVDRFTPEPDRAANYWYARDVDVLAGALGTEPVLIVARETSETDAQVTPLPVDTSGIPNDHLEYAITWFGLALVWITMTGVWLRRIARGRD